MAGYCSDITRTVFTGPPPAEFRELYDVLQQAQGEAVGCRDDRAHLRSRRRRGWDRIVEAGFGDFFIHRTGHGIGLEEHEDPYLVARSTTPSSRQHV